MNPTEDDLGKEANSFLQPQESPANRQSRAWMDAKKKVAESMDFDEMESIMWRKV